MPRSSSSPPSARAMVAAAAKRAIAANLSAAAADLADRGASSTGAAAAIGSDRAAANALCAALEAALVHGVRGGGLGGTRLLRAIAGSATGGKRTLPDTNFWLFLMIFTHGDTLRRINQLPQINTDVGRCRAWIRLNLNEGLLGSYLKMFAADRKSCRKHYDRSSLMRDQEAMEDVIKCVQEVELLRFDLAANAGILNAWQTPPLVMAGLWVPDKLSEPATDAAEDALTQVDAAEDAAECFADEEEQSSNGVLPLIRPVWGAGGLLGEDEALRLILAGSGAASVSSSSAASTPALATSPPAPPSLVGSRVGRGGDAVLQKADKAQERDTQQSRDVETRVAAASENRSLDDSGVSEKTESVSSAEKRDVVEADTEALISADKSARRSKTGASSVTAATSFTRLKDRESGESSNWMDESLQEEEEADVGCSDMTSDENRPPPSLLEICKEFDNGEMDGDDVEDRVEEAAEVREGDDVQFKRLRAAAEEVVGGGRRTRRRKRRGEEELEVAVPRLAGFIDCWNPFSSGRHFDTPPATAETDDDDGGAGMKMGFSLQKDVSIGTLNVEDSQRLMAAFDKLPREVGLDRQEYECADCSRAVGAVFGPVAGTCGYTGRYLCGECLAQDEATIPVRVVLNWDFCRYPVGRKAKVFLDKIREEPILDAADMMSPALLQFAPALSNVLALRKKLNYLSAYLQTCGRHPEVYRAFAAQVPGREYLVADVSKFSVRDLEEVHSEELLRLLQRMYDSAAAHVLRCALCSGKGFICELCRRMPPVYPFHLESISQCARCHTVFHLECSQGKGKLSQGMIAPLNQGITPQNGMMACPRCERKEARSLNWHVSSARCRRDRRHADVGDDDDD